MYFTQYDVPDLSGTAAVVTGATGGLGLEIARMLAGAGAHVILAGRSTRKGADAVAYIRSIVVHADIVFEMLDLASLASVADFGARMRVAGKPIDLLINNAGVMTPPTRRSTSDGFELQFGTNHLGHYALTGRLLPLLIAARTPRVVTVSSGMAKFGRIDFDNLGAERVYKPIPAYGQSKLANLLFARQFQKLSDSKRWNILLAMAHPGHARTDLIANGQGELRGIARLGVKLIQAIASHDATGGAMPIMLAATGHEVKRLDYYGPSQMMEQKGPPKLVRLPRQAEDDNVAKRLWEVSERLTGVAYGVE